MPKSTDRLPPLELLATFDAAARRLSFTLAGEERFITQSAVSRQIRSLEDDLGVALFRRHHRALTLTDDGQRLHAACTAALGLLREAAATLRAPARRELLALTTTPSLASLWLIPRLSAFTRAHPEIDVRLDATYAKRDLKSDGFDIALRYARTDGPAPGQPMFSISTQPVCAPALRRSGPPLRTPADLRHHTLLQVSETGATGLTLEWETWLQAVGLPELQPAASLTFSNSADAMTAALAGQGIVLGRRPLVDALLRSRKLVAPFKDQTASPRSYFLVTNPAARARPAVHALEAWLLAEAAATA